jgi:uncharacterized membrane protein YidH (DUF202 family)
VKILEMIGFSIAVIIICAALLIFLMGGLKYQHGQKSKGRGAARPS